MEENTAFGAFIQKKRREGGFTQRALAQRLHVTESAVSKWERGVSYPDITMIPGLCEALAVSERELITASEDFAQRRVERAARSLRHLRKGLLWILNVSCGAALLTCLVLTLAGPMRRGTLLVVAASLLTGASLTTLPLLLPKGRRGWGALAGFYPALCLLLAVLAWYTGGRWLLMTLSAVTYGLVLVCLPLALRAIPLPGAIAGHKTLLCFAVYSLLLFPLLAAILGFAGEGLFFPAGVTIALMGLALCWGIMLLLRYAPLTGLTKAALCCALGGLFNLFFNPVIRTVTEGAPFALTPPNFLVWANPDILNANIDFLTTLLLWAAAAALGIMALRRRQKR
ncbi:MAG: helix-turn-helix domain-containing protein [Firmicutes bacterium]|nr:helix-turn-helix domain-containing protein [Bacillota bacterium]